MITLAGLRDAAANREAVTFNGDPRVFRIVVADPCSGRCELDLCAGVLTLESVSSPGARVGRVHVGVNSAFQRAVTS